MYLDAFENRKWVKNMMYDELKITTTAPIKSSMKDIQVSFWLEKNSSHLIFQYDADNGTRKNDYDLIKNGKSLQECRIVPFEIGKFELGKKYPVLLYGSVWKDSSGEVKFCTEKELSPDKGKNKCLDSIPYYLILTVQLTEIEE